MTSPALDTTQDSGTDDETFWDEGGATGDALGAAFGGASIAGASIMLTFMAINPAWDSARTSTLATCNVLCFLAFYNERYFNHLVYILLPHTTMLLCFVSLAQHRVML